MNTAYQTQPEEPMMEEQKLKGQFVEGMEYGSDGWPPGYTSLPAPLRTLQPMTPTTSATCLLLSWRLWVSNPGVAPPKNRRWIHLYDSRTILEFLTHLSPGMHVSFQYTNGSHWHGGHFGSIPNTEQDNLIWCHAPLLVGLCYISNHGLNGGFPVLAINHWPTPDTPPGPLIWSEV